MSGFRWLCSPLAKNVGSTFRLEPRNVFNQVALKLRILLEHGHFKNIAASVIAYHLSVRPID